MQVVTIAHAVCDERGQKSGGLLGNQTQNNYNTSGELRFSDWYLSGGKSWDYVIRAKKKYQRIAIASAAMAAVRNKNIGYDQENRETLYDALKFKQFDITRLERPVACDCSSLVVVCCNYANIPLLRGTYSGNLKDRCEAVGMFKIFKGKKYTQWYEELEAGDILVREGFHCCIVVNTHYHMTHYLKMGCKGEDVKYLQQELNDWINAGLKVDGDFGFKTDAALRGYQTSYGLTPDGVMGPLTASMIGFLWR